jgi:hypothetical protein
LISGVRVADVGYFSVGCNCYLMHELREELKTLVQDKLAPFLLKFGFQFHLSVHEYSNTHDVFTFKKPDDSYILIDHMGFHFHDYPWSINPTLGQPGFKTSTTQFDTVPLWYLKQKLAPFEAWQREALKISFDNYPVNSIDQIRKSIDQTIFDLDTFCKDFLTGNFLTFNRARQIRYLEHLTQIQVFGEYHWTGKKKFTFYHNKEVD